MLEGTQHNVLEQEEKGEERTEVSGSLCQSRRRENRTSQGRMPAHSLVSGQNASTLLGSSDLSTRARLHKCKSC